MDCVRWTNSGRYLIVSIGEKRVIDGVDHNFSTVLIWSALEQKVIQKISHCDEFFKSNIFMIAVHPHLDTVFVTGEAGRVHFWQVGCDTPLKSFYETGAVSGTPNLMCDILDGQFSQDGRFFALTTIAGTLSIYTQLSAESYRVSPTEQCFHLDLHNDSNHKTYLQNAPKLSDAKLIPYEH